jgi:Kelch motif
MKQPADVAVADNPVVWQVDTPLNGARVNHTAAVMKGSLFVMGGMREGAGHDQIDANREFLKSTEWTKIEKDGSLSIWQAGPDMKRARVGSSAIAFGKWLFVIGGEQEASIERAEPTANGMQPWELIGALPDARFQFGVVTVADRLYVIGGIEKNKVASTCIVARINANGGIGKWETGPSLVSSRRGFAVVSAQGYVFAIGGNDGEGSLRTIERAKIDADGSLGAWQIVEQALITAREGTAAVVSKNTVLVSGGYKTGGDYLASVESAEIGAKGEMGAFEDMRFGHLRRPHGYHQAVTIGADIYVVGGGSDKGFTPVVERLQIK